MEVGIVPTAFSSANAGWYSDGGQTKRSLSSPLVTSTPPVRGRQLSSASQLSQLSVRQAAKIGWDTLKLSASEAGRHVLPVDLLFPGKHLSQLQLSKPVPASPGKTPPLGIVQAISWLSLTSPPARPKISDVSPRSPVESPRTPPASPSGQRKAAKGSDAAARTLKFHLQPQMNDQHVKRIFREAMRSMVTKEIAGQAGPAIITIAMGAGAILPFVPVVPRPLLTNTPATPSIPPARSPPPSAQSTHSFEFLEPYGFVSEDDMYSSNAHYPLAIDQANDYHAGLYSTVTASRQERRRRSSINMGTLPLENGKMQVSSPVQPVQRDAHAVLTPQQERITTAERNEIMPASEQTTQVPIEGTRAASMDDNATGVHGTPPTKYSFQPDEIAYARAALGFDTLHLNQSAGRKDRSTSPRVPEPRIFPRNRSVSPRLGRQTAGTVVDRRRQINESVEKFFFSSSNATEGRVNSSADANEALDKIHIHERLQDQPQAQNWKLIDNGVLVSEHVAADGASGLLPSTPSSPPQSLLSSPLEYQTASESGSPIALKRRWRKMHADGIHLPSEMEDNSDVPLVKRSRFPKFATIPTIFEIALLSSDMADADRPALSEHGSFDPSIQQVSESPTSTVAELSSPAHVLDRTYSFHLTDTGTSHVPPTISRRNAKGERIFPSKSFAVATPVQKASAAASMSAARKSGAKQFEAPKVAESASKKSTDKLSPLPAPRTSKGIQAHLQRMSSVRKPATSKPTGLLSSKSFMVAPSKSTPPATKPAGKDST